MNCERCEERDRIRAGHQDEWGAVLCDDCRDAEAEAAYERMCEDFYGGSGPVTIREQYDAAVQQRRDLRLGD